MGLYTVPGWSHCNAELVLMDESRFPVVQARLPGDPAIPLEFREGRGLWVDVASPKKSTPTKKTLSPRRRDGVLPTIIIRSYSSSWSGYGQIAEWLGRELENHGHAVGYCPIMANHEFLPIQGFVTDRLVGAVAPGGRVVQLAVPKTEPLDTPTVAFTMWETTKIRECGIGYLNRCQVVVVPCQWNADCLQAQGVTVPIHVVPLGIDAGEGYAPKVWPGGSFTFGMAGRMAHGGSRKGLNEGMAAFVKAFPNGEDVRLILKVFPDCLPLLTVPDDPRITLDTTAYLPPQMADWYGSIHCLVVPSKSEGFGMHTLQAMACERPVIAANQTGTAQFWTPSCGWELAGEWAPVSGFPEYEGLGEWFVPSEASMVAAMRAAVAHPGIARKLGKLAAVRAAEFPWSRTGDELHAVLAGLGWVAPKPRAVPRLEIACDHRVTGRVGCCTTWICKLHGGRHAPVGVCDTCDDRTDI